MPLQALAGFAGTDVFLPMAGRQAGVHPSNWYTALWIHNPGSQAVTARVYLLERGTANLNPPWVDYAIGAGETELIDNAVETLFQRQVFGALRVTCASQELLVSSRVYSREAGAGPRDSVGQDFAGVPASFAIGVGERTTILGVHQTQPSESSDFRYNFGFVETTGHTATVRVRAFGGDNVDQGFVDLQVREWSQRQVAFRDHFPQVSTENSRLQVEVIAGAGKVIPYGSLIANGAQDPTTFEASVTPPPAATIPAGAVMMFDLATCPAGWSELVAARGRAVVGVPSGGTPAGTVGAALGDLEDRQHTHVVNPEEVPTALAGDHAHTVGPVSIPTTGVGNHTHTVDVPWTESEGVPGHTHSVPGVVTTTGMSGSHNHKWSEFHRPCGGECGGSWNAYNTSGTEFTLITYSAGNPGLNQEGSGTFPLALADDPVGDWNLYTTDTTHQHTFEVPARTAAAGGIHAHGVNPAAFGSGSAGTHSHDVSVSTTSAIGGSHFHAVNVPATESGAARTSGVMPYIQLLVCRKD